MPKSSYINGREISEKNSPFIIAEISANHNGDIENAFAIIKMAKDCGADAVKMQTYKPDTVLNSQNDFLIKDGLWAGQLYTSFMIGRIHPGNGILNCFSYAKKIGITIFSTPLISLRLIFWKI